MMETASMVENLGTTVLAVGALGTASFGVVDGLKLLECVDLAGFKRIFCGAVSTEVEPAARPAGATLDGLLPALEAAYGQDALTLLKAQYRCGRDKGDLPRTLRQGVRIGFGLMDAAQISRSVQAIGIPKQAADAGAEALVAERDAVSSVPNDTAGAMPSDHERSAIARIESALDARIEAALSLASLDYVAKLKVMATFVSLVIAAGVNWCLGGEWPIAVVVGLAAVPFAPIAKDLATAIQEASKAMKAVR